MPVGNPVGKPVGKLVGMGNPLGNPVGKPPGKPPDPLGIVGVVPVPVAVTVGVDSFPDEEEPPPLLK